jgi:hypothetical protein
LVNNQLLVGLRPRAFHDAELLRVTRSTKDAERLADCTALPGCIALGLADRVQQTTTLSLAMLRLTDPESSNVDTR